MVLVRQSITVFGGYEPVRGAGQKGGGGGGGVGFGPVTGLCCTPQRDDSQ